MKFVYKKIPHIISFTLLGLALVVGIIFIQTNYDRIENTISHMDFYNNLEASTLQTSDSGGKILLFVDDSLLGGLKK